MMVKLRFTNPHGPLHADVEGNTSEGYWVTFYQDSWGLTTAGTQYAKTLKLAKKIANHYVMTGEWRTFGARMG